MLVPIFNGCPFSNNFKSLGMTPRIEEIWTFTQSSGFATKDAISIAGIGTNIISDI